MDTARKLADHVVALLAPHVKFTPDVEKLLASIKREGECQPSDEPPISFDHPAVWSAFHLVGRVT